MAGFLRWFSNLLHPNQDDGDQSSHSINYTVSDGNKSVTVSHPYEIEVSLVIEDNQSLDSIDDDVSHITHLISTGGSARSMLKQLNSFVSLTHLIVVKSGLKELPSSIGLLFQLRILDVTDNTLIELPDTISTLRNLQKLFVMYNKLKHLPKGIIELPLLEQVEVLGNPLVWPPMDVAKNGIAEIKSFMHEYFSKEDERQDVLRNSKAYGSSLYKSGFTVPALQEIVTSFILENNIEHEYLPTRLNHRLAAVEDFTQFHITISKCSHCLKYFSSPTSYQTHICYTLKVLK